jgi:F-type H+-transporting ATPase subunit epsilon
MPFELHIVTPEGEVFRDRVESVVIPGSEGDFGVLADHERFVCPVRVGELEIRSRSGATWASVATGFADVSGTEVSVMVESCELAPQIDAARAERAKTRAERRLKEAGVGVEEELDAERAELALERAKTRIAVSRRS